MLGETGTGKEAFARAVQLALPGGPDGRPAPSAALNAAAIPDTLVESALFGHRRGAFTGATEPRVGALRHAPCGTFFLDEVGDLPPHTQAKLLRVIETNEVFPLGADTPEPARVRYVAATHHDLERMIERGDFRRDLFGRLAGNVVPIPTAPRTSPTSVAPSSSATSQAASPRPSPPAPTGGRAPRPRARTHGPATYASWRTRSAT